MRQTDDVVRRLPIDRVKMLGARHGEAGLPRDLLAALHDGPFGPTHLRRLAAAVDRGSKPPSYSVFVTTLRNLILLPIVLAHGFRRLLP